MDETELTDPSVDARRGIERVEVIVLDKIELTDAGVDVCRGIE